MFDFEKSVDDYLATIESLRNMSEILHVAANRCRTVLDRGDKLLICGNGGSAAQAMHLTAELIGRYKDVRRPLAAITLGTDPSVATCIGNDYSFEELFSRQVRGLGRPGDLLITFSTSGNSANIVSALKAARETGMESIAFLGRSGGPALALTDYALLVNQLDTARIQDAHQFLMHGLMDLIESGSQYKLSQKATVLSR